MIPAKAGIDRHGTLNGFEKRNAGIQKEGWNLPIETGNIHDEEGFSEIMARGDH